MTGGAPRILIRHLSGSRANQVQDFGLDGRREIRLGRDAAADVSYDPTLDDVVSRVHALIAISGSEASPSFHITDLKSSNGTFVNKKPIGDKTELLPEDLVTLGKNGPSFIFDIQPRPATLGARTRILDAIDPATTRTMNAADAALIAAAGPAATKTTSADPGATSTRANAGASATRSDNQAAPKDAIGKETLHAILADERNQQDQQRKLQTRNIILIAGGALAALALLAGALSWKSSKNEESQQASLEDARRASDDARSDSHEAVEGLKRRLGMSPQEIVRQFGPATVKVKVQWRLYDERTGKPVFIDTVERSGERWPVYFKLPDGTLVPYLTLEDNDRRNTPVYGVVQGSGFVVDERGFILTNKHLAGGWESKFSVSEKKVHVVEATGNKRGPSTRFTTMETDSDVFKSGSSWIPKQGGILFLKSGLYGNVPDPTKNDRRTFLGRNDFIEVTFPEQGNPVNATLVRLSNESDAALVKIDSPQRLHFVPVENESVFEGESVTVLGFPKVSIQTYKSSQTVENGTIKTNTEIIPKPFVTDGIVAQVTTSKTETKKGETGGLEGDVIQLTINSTGFGNSGGPVFNSQGKVIGLFTYLYSAGEAHNSGAVPIKYGVELLKSQ